jgi:23S rRNA (guanosine2251-2'-O)-methyltransferase
MNIYNFTSLTKRQQAKKICDLIERVIFLEKRKENKEIPREFEKLHSYLQITDAKWFKPGDSRLDDWAAYNLLPFPARAERLRKIQYLVMDKAGIKHSESDFLNLKQDEAGNSQARGNVRLDFELMVCDVRSPFNIGSMVRTAEAFGFSKVLLCGISSRCEDIKIFKTSMMAEKFLQIERCPDTKGAVKYIEKKRSIGWKAVSLEKTPSSREISSASGTGKVILIVGNEEFGVPEEVLSVSDEIRHISLSGVKNSVNVAVAFGIAAWVYTTGRIKSSVE